MNSKISIVTITYNAKSVLEETILSVINQSYDNIEYIVIDGGSTDGTIEIIKKYQDKISYWISEPDRGIYDAMNKGIGKASGEWINFMNAGDCFYNCQTVYNIVDFLSQKKDIDILYGDVFLKTQRKIGKKYNLDRVKYHMPFCHQSSFIRTELHKKRPFSLGYRYTADYDFFYYIFSQGFKFCYFDNIISIYDESGVSSLNHKECLIEYANIRGDFKTLKFRLYFYSILSYLYLKKILNK